MSDFAAEATLDDICDALKISGSYSQVRKHKMGGLGVVLRAFDEQLKRDVAIKAVREELACDAETLQRFAAEMEVTAQLDHPGVIPVFGSGVTVGNRPFYAMRFVDGRDLSDDIDDFFSCASPNFDGVAFRDLLQRFIVVCKTVAYAHNRGIVHRDIKPQNIRSGKYGETLLLDWGLAVRIDRTDAYRKSGEVSLILTGDGNTGVTSGGGAGTVAYMSPEQISGLVVTPAADVYSLGATLFKIVTGSSTIDTIEGGDNKGAILEGRIPSPVEIQPNLPKPLVSICQRALSLRPADRYSNALELASDLERYLAGESVSVHAESPAERVGRWIRHNQYQAKQAGFVVFLLFILSLLAAIYMMQLARERKFDREAALEQRAIALKASKDAADARDSSLLISATLAARSLATEIVLRGSLLREESASNKMRSLVEVLNNDINNEQARKGLNDWIRERFLANVSVNLPTSSWSIYGRDGTQFARVSPQNSGDSDRSLFKNFSYRDYFHGLGVDLEKDSKESRDVAPHSQSVHVSTVYLSSNSNQLCVSFSVPIWSTSDEESNSHVVGILASSVQLAKLDLLPGTMLIDLRPAVISGQREVGLVLRRPEEVTFRRGDPVLIKCDDEMLNLLLEQHNKIPASFDKGHPSHLVAFRDPQTQESSKAAIATVRLNLGEDNVDTGWRVIVADRKGGLEKLKMPETLQ